VEGSPKARATAGSVQPGGKSVYITLPDIIPVNNRLVIVLSQFQKIHQTGWTNITTMSRPPSSSPMRMVAMPAASRTTVMVDFWPTRSVIQPATKAINNLVTWEKPIKVL
jgi:hypothetical protein